jgi:molybdenum cofactor guanylyltransferase
MNISIKNISVVILAGGRGSRMQGQDKGLIKWQNKTLIEHVLENISANVGEIIINANRNEDFYKKFNCRVIKDSTDSFQGPLAGILSAMEQCKYDYLLCLPCDCPRPPEELTERLMQCLQNSSSLCAICHDGKREQALFCLISCAAKPQLKAFLSTDKRKVHDFFQRMNAAVCDFSDQADRFKNFNTPDDIA